MRSLVVDKADLEKYLWGGERGAGILEGWQHMADVYTGQLLGILGPLTEYQRGPLYPRIFHCRFFTTVHYDVFLGFSGFLTAPGVKDPICFLFYQ